MHMNRAKQTFTKYMNNHDLEQDILELRGKGLSQKSVAKGLNLSQSRVSRIEKSRTHNAKINYAIKAYRTGKKQLDIAYELDVSQPTISRWVTGVIKPRVTEASLREKYPYQTQKKIAELEGISQAKVSRLLRGSGRKGTKGTQKATQKEIAAQMGVSQSTISRNLNLKTRPRIKPTKFGVPVEQREQSKWNTGFKGGYLDVANFDAYMAQQKELGGGRRINRENRTWESESNPIYRERLTPQQKLAKRKAQAAENKRDKERDIQRLMQKTGKTRREVLAMNRRPRTKKG